MALVNSGRSLLLNSCPRKAEKSFVVSASGAEKDSKLMSVFSACLSSCSLCVSVSLFSAGLSVCLCISVYIFLCY